jgi:hypothetical protein
MTIHQAGELLLDVVTTADVRRHGASSYIRSIEDFVFAVVYFDGLVLSGSAAMPWRQGPSPGADLLNRFPGLVRTVDEAAPHTPESLLSMHEFRDRVERDLANLETAVALGKKYFRAWILRDAQVYLGQHPTIFQPWRSPDSFVYGVFRGVDGEGASEPRNYLTDRQLQALIPRAVIAEVSGYIPYDVRGGACAPAVSEFVSRNLLQLVVLLRWRETLPSYEFDSLIKLVPHSTRAAVIQAEIEQSSAEWLETQRALVIPALGMALQTQPQSRDDLIERIREMRDVASIAKVRKAVRNFMLEARPEHKKRLLNDIRRMLSLSTVAPDEILVPPAHSQVVLSAGLPGLSAQIKGSVIDNLKGILPFSRGRAFRRLSTFSRESQPGLLRRICPELGYSDQA